MRLVLAVALVAGCSFDKPTDICDGPCSLFGIERSLARSNGEQIWLEGIFEVGAEVSFPGVTQRQTIDTPFPFRAAVTVPEGTTAGDVTVRWRDGTTSLPFPFRSPSFAMGLQAFQPFDDQTTVGRFRDPFPYRRGHTAIVLDHRMYLVGGYTNATADTSVEMSLVGLDGSIAQGSTVSQLKRGRAFHTMVRAGDFVYVIGGQGSPDTVEAARLADDGSLGTFELVSGVSLRTPRSGHASALIGNYIYVFGGLDAALKPLSSIERAPVYENGAIGNFEPMNDNALPTPRAYFTVAVVDQRLFVIGGIDSAGSQLMNVEQASIYPDTGYIGSFDPGGSLNARRSNHMSIVVGNELYVIGGTSGGSAIDTVERAKVLGGEIPTLTFTTDTAKLAEPRQDAVAFVAGNFVYLMGGTKATESPVLLLERASFISAGAISEINLVPSTPPLITGREGHAAVVVGDTLYVIGGTDPGGQTLGSIEQAKINADGTLDDFSLADTALLYPRTGASVFVGRTFLYVAGGRTTGSLSRDIEAIPIDPVTGALGPSMKLEGKPLLADRDHMTTLAVTGLVYWFGGQSMVGPDTTEYSIFNQQMLSVPAGGPVPIPARRSAAGFAFRNRYYVLGGFDGSDFMQDVARFSLSADSQLGSLSSPGDLSARRQGHSLVALGDRLYMLGGYGNALSTQPGVPLVTTIPADGNLGAFSDAGFQFGPRGNFPTVTLGDHVYVIGGSTSPGARDGTLPSATIISK